MRLNNFQTLMLTVIILSVTFAGYKGCQIENERAVLEAKIHEENETVRKVKEQAEGTQRTGERWQFLQKVVPWGEDE